jgi:hypothetical protein
MSDKMEIFLHILPPVYVSLEEEIVSFSFKSISPFAEERL